MKSTIRVLYAEDNPQDADLTRTHFAAHAPEFAIEIVTSGHECLDRLREAVFDVVLLDQRLPDMDGLEVLKALADTGALTPVVLVTGVGTEDLVVRALRFGVVDYVSKRDNYLTELPATVRRVVAAGRERRQLGLPPANSPRQVLYVEDDAMDIDRTLDYCRQTAPHLKFQVARTGQESLAAIKCPGWDLVLLDIVLPDMNGLELLRQLKHEGCAVPVVVVTGHGNEETALAALKLGAREYVPKREDYLPHLAVVIDLVITRVQLERTKEAENAKLKDRLLALENLLPICMYCKKILQEGKAYNDPQSWVSIEEHLLQSAGILVSHGMCPTCNQKVRDAYSATRDR